MKRVPVLVLIALIIPTLALGGPAVMWSDFETCPNGLLKVDKAARKVRCVTYPPCGGDQGLAPDGGGGLTCRTFSASTPPTPAADTLLAFRGAEGSAANTSGGRGGRIYTVNTLADTTGACVLDANGITTSGTCSLRDCVRGDGVGARTCIPRVAGTTLLTNHLYISNPYLTIAGQAAPGGGLQISGKNLPGSAAALVYIEGHDIIWRYTKLRHGWNANTLDQKGSVFNVQKDSYSIAADHNSLEWSQDEVVTIWGSGAGYALTFSWNIIAEPLTQGDGGAHQTSFITGGTGGSESQIDLDIHHNVFANSNHRNPMLKNKSTRVVSNIVYNWSAHAMQTMGGTAVDIINNKWVAGPLMPASPYDHEIEVNTDCDGSTVCAAGSPSLYVTGNIGPRNANPQSDNWALMVRESATENGAEIGTLSASYQRVTPMGTVGVAITADAATQLDAVILPTVGASRRLNCYGDWVSMRDAVDTRILGEYQARTGIKPNTETDVGGFPTIDPGTPCTDTDRDGMPDAWEAAQGLNSSDPSDAWTIEPGQVYPNLERYLNGPVS
jgi:pectate lyase